MDQGGKLEKLRGRSGRRKDWIHYVGRQLRANDAAVGGDRASVLRSSNAATVRGFVSDLLGLLQADSGRHEERTHKQDGNRSALENTSQHGLSLADVEVAAVIWITRPGILGGGWVVGRGVGGEGWVSCLSEAGSIFYRGLRLNFTLRRAECLWYVAQNKCGSSLFSEVDASVRGMDVYKNYCAPK